MSNCCTNTSNKLWAISYAVALANVIRILNWLFSVSGLAIMLKCKEKKTSETKVQCLIYSEAWVTIFLSQICRKTLRGKKKLEAKFGACLEIPVWVYEEGKKIQGMEWGSMCNRRVLSVDRKLLLTFFSLCGSTPHNWQNHSWDREMNIQVGPECTVRNFKVMISILKYISLYGEKSLYF